MEKQRIVIVGGGFAGVKTALELSKGDLKDIKITLISDRDRFEYHGALYRTATGRSPLEVCIPLRDILDERQVEIVRDTIVSISDATQTVRGVSGSEYRYDTLVLGLGSETNYFGVPGIQEHSLSMKTIDNALRLKWHIDEVLGGCTKRNTAQQLCSGKFIVIGGGATGVELAAELFIYAKKRARALNINSSLVAVSLIEAKSRLLPTLPEEVSIRVERQLRSLGVNIHLNRSVLSQELTGVALQDMEMKSSTVIWTAGVAAHRLHKDLSRAQFDKQGRVFVDRHQYAIGYDTIFVLGDGAATEYSGMAQTALAHAKRAVGAMREKKRPTGVRFVHDPKPLYAIPVGGKWSAAMFGPLTFYGYVGWMLRRLLDLIVFATFLPIRQALSLFAPSDVLSKMK